MSKSRAKGTKFESEVVAYLNDHGFPHAERRAMAGALDKGDIAGVPGVVLECKSVKSIDLAGFVDEASAEGQNAHAAIAVAVIKRRMKPTGQAYVVMPLSQFVEMIR